MHDAWLASAHQVETVGDVYVLASGLPIRIGDRHVVEIANCALDLMSAVLGLRIPSLPNYKVQLRMGKTLLYDGVPAAYDVICFITRSWQWHGGK